VNTPETPAGPGTPRAQLVSYTQLIYALHSLSILIGLLTSAFVVTAFISGLPSIVAVVMNYARRSEAQGTWLESHFRWQIHTFWLALAGFLSMMLLVFTILMIPLAWLGFLLIGLWVIYRVARGWLALREGRAVPA
jgi:uncharacterized membrane protein